MRIRTDISATLFLTAPDEYDGGELVIEDQYGAHQVKLPAGEMVLYPATSLHRVNPITRGSRVGCFFWVQSLVRDDTQRTLLAVMFLGLFMNAAISSAFSSSPWPFAVPYLISQIGPTAVTAITVGPAELRRHYRRVLVWLAAAAPLWIAGAILQPRPRLACWAAAAAIDLAPDPESIRARSPRTHHAGTATPLATCSQAKPLMRATVFPHEPALGRRAAQTARTVSPGDSLASYAAAFGNHDHAGAGAKAG